MTCGVTRLHAQKFSKAQLGLKDLAPEGFYIGGVLHGDDASFQDLAYRAVAKKHFNVVTSSVYMPWGRWAGPGQSFEFSDFSSVVDWSVANNQQVHGHVLVYPWANTQSAWWMALPDTQVEALLFQYVDALVRERAGNIWVWDVVNEVIANDGEPMDADGLRTNVKEYQAMGSDYIETIFGWAAAADPAAKLILNSTGCEWLGPKSDRLFNYVIKLKARGVPIDGVGFQFHFVDLGSPAPDIDSMKANLNRFADAGFEIYFTEVDVCSTQSVHPSKQWPSKEDHSRQALHYYQLLEMALDQPACKAFMLWDFADDYSWLHPTSFQISSMPANVFTFPAPFNGGATTITEKPAVRAMRKALQSKR